MFSNFKMKMMIPTYVLELPTKVVSSNYDHSFEFLSLSENCCLRTLLIILFVAVLGRDGRGTISETWKCYPFVRKKIDKLIELQGEYIIIPWIEDLIFSEGQNWKMQPHYSSPIMVCQDPLTQQQLLTAQVRHREAAPPLLQSLRCRHWLSYRCAQSQRSSPEWRSKS